MGKEFDGPVKKSRLLIKNIVSGSMMNIDNIELANIWKLDDYSLSQLSYWFKEIFI